MFIDEFLIDKKVGIFGSPENGALDVVRLDREYRCP